MSTTLDVLRRLEVLRSLAESSDDDFDEASAVEEAELIVAGARTASAGSRTKKALTDKVRRNVRRLENESAVCRPLRSLAELQNVDWGKELISQRAAGDDESFTSWDCKEGSLITLREYSESRTWGSSFVTSGPAHPQFLEKPCSTLTVTRAICREEHCGFYFDIRRQSEDGRYALLNFKGHDEYCNILRVTGRVEGGTVKRRKRLTAYSSENLARAFVASFSSLKTLIKPADIKTFLSTFVRTTPTDDLAERVTAVAMELLRGAPQNNFKLLIPFMQQLRGLGWTADFIQFDHVQSRIQCRRTTLCLFFCLLACLLAC